MARWEELAQTLIAQIRPYEPYNTGTRTGLPPMRSSRSGMPGWPPEVDWTAPTAEVVEGYLGPTLPLYESLVPLTGYLGPQRTRRGTATVMNIGVTIDGQEWLIPQLTPNQDPEDLFALLSGQPLTPEQEDRITARAIEFAMAEERRQPGTFPKYDSILDLEADAAGESAGKRTPMVQPFDRPRYPGRP